MKSKLLMILSMSTFGTVGLFVRMIPLTSGEIALARAVLAAAAIALYLALVRKPVRLRGLRGGGLLLLSGALMGFNWVALFEAYRYTTVSVATLSYNIAPLLVMVLSALLMHEKMSRFQLLCLLMSMLSLALIVNTSGAGSANPALGVLLGLLAAMLYASVVMLNRLIKDVGGVHRTLLQFIAAIAVLVSYVLLGGGAFTQPLAGRALLALLTLGLVHTGLMYCLYFTAIQGLKGREIAILSFIDPLVAVIGSALFLQEPFTPRQMLGGAVILLATYLSGRAGRREEQRLSSAEVH
ncbi:MAG: DMT family transporter [Clostridiales bacterium]|nr:DMT family transporter [Clostridiales bacterium]